MDKFAVGGKREILAIGKPPGGLEPGDIIARYKPVSDYGAIGNTFTGALIARDGSIDWCCLPRFDSPSTFAAILDARKGGHFAIRPAVAFRSSQRYIFDTNILVTTFETMDRSGEVEVVDLMPLPHGSQWERTELHRLVCGVRGRMELDLIFRPRFDYGRTVPTMKVHQHGVVAHSPSSRLALSTVPLNFRLHDETAVARLDVKDGEVLPVVMVYGEVEPKGVTDYHSLDKLSEMQGYWREWVGKGQYVGGWRDHVMRSALLLKLLFYSERGTFVSSLTTSLPVETRASRTYDGRYVWIRDASSIVEAMLNFGCPGEEVGRFVRSLTEVCRGDVKRLAMVCGVGGELDIKERRLSTLEGYRGTQPVVIGSDATGKFCLAPFGELLHSWRVYWQKTGDMPRDVWTSLLPLADFIVRHWREPDYGRWEGDAERRHYTYSKVMCAVGLDAAISLAENLGFQGEIETWRKIEGSILNEVMTKGWSDRRQSFVRYFGDDELDASALLFPLYGFIQADHPRMISTADQIVRNLNVDGLLRRFEMDESAFPICSFWLARYFIRVGQAHDAEQLFGRMIDLGNHLSLYSEAVDPKTREFLGNFPSALVHAAFVNSARELSEALASL